MVKNLVPIRRASLLVAALALVASACGGSGDVETAAPTASAEADAPPSVVEVGEQNQALLEQADDARDVEVLDVSDGSISTLRAAVDGDRPVLVWFYAPH